MCVCVMNRGGSEAGRGVGAGRIGESCKLVEGGLVGGGRRVQKRCCSQRRGGVTRSHDMYELFRGQCQQNASRVPRVTGEQGGVVVVVIVVCRASGRGASETER